MAPITVLCLMLMTVTMVTSDREPHVYCTPDQELRELISHLDNRLISLEEKVGTGSDIP